MVEIYDSHEQSERVKGWLAENGGAIVLGLVLAFGSLFGIKQWQLWQLSNTQQASAEFEVMVELLGQQNLDAAVANFETLRSEYEESPYTSLASLHMARARIEAGQTDLAVQLLEFAMKNGKPEPVKATARMRLARVKLDLGLTDEATALLASAPVRTGFEAQIAELEGDIARQKGDLESAKQHYSEALTLLEAGTGDRDFLEIKLDAIRQSEAKEEEAS